MTLRSEEITCHRANREGDRYAWQLRFKGVEGRGLYGSVITDWSGRGLYLLAEGDLLGDPGYQERMMCLAPITEFHLDIDASAEYACESMVAVLLGLGWGPRVGHRDSSPTLQRKALDAK